MPLRAVFFDLDDTLCDTTGTQLQRAQRVLHRLQPEVPRLDASRFVERALRPDVTTGFALGVRPLIEELGLLGTDAGQETLEMWFFQGCFDLLASFPETAAAVRRLSERFVLGVVTNGSEARQRAKFDHLSFSRHFQVFLTSERANEAKPSPGIFRTALAEAGVAAVEAAFVGDRLDIDVLGAQAAGMRTIWLDHGGRIAGGVGPDPDAVIRRFGELPAALERLGPN